ncbi:MAG: hypothetical protein ABL925_08130 [Methylococcales bacterium]
MKFLILLLSLTATSICFAEGKLPAGHPPVNQDHAKMPPAAAQLSQKGKVLDVINVPQYTYLEISQENQSRWLAAPTVEVKKGDMIKFNDGLEMKDFHSNALDRTFPVIFFVNSVVVGE